MRLPPDLAIVWLLRVLWLLVPVLSGASIADALDDRSSAVALTVGVLAYAVWAVGVLASLVLRTVSLTALRLVVPGGVVVAVWAATQTEIDAASVLGIAIALGALLVLASPATADAFVDGSSYGDERRVALRTPPAFQLFIVPVAWAAMAALAVGGPVLLAAEQWLVGAGATVAGVGLVALVGTRIHQLSRRWIVFVPAGVVVHDPLVLAEAVMVPRHLVRRFGPAEVGTDAVDLTAGALGLALELRPAEPIDISRRDGRRGSVVEVVPAVVVAPGRPGTTMELARARQLPVGVS